MTDKTPTANRLLAIADIVSHNQLLLDEIEGHLLVAAGENRQLTPARLALETTLTRDAAADLFRQLVECGAVHRQDYTEAIVSTPFTVSAAAVRSLMARTHEAIEVVSAHRERTPTTEVTPLVTFPDDPAFAETSASAFEMEGLMSTLASEVKRCEERIVLLSPFFERGGFERLADVLLDALDRGVELIIVTRYLADPASYNYGVISEFTEQARERGVSRHLTTVDYTVWDEEIPVDERTQNGANPSFTLHAKVMLFDSETAYIGSANVTDYGFDRFLELGVRLRGTKVKPFRELCEFLLASEGAVSVEV